MTNNLVNNLPNEQKVLALDNDLLFQDDPFLMFKEFPNNNFTTQDLFFLSLKAEDLRKYGDLLNTQ